MATLITTNNRGLGFVSQCFILVANLFKFKRCVRRFSSEILGTLIDVQRSRVIFLIRIIASASALNSRFSLGPPIVARITRTGVDEIERCGLGLFAGTQEHAD
jgi:hypothetical protein